MDTFVTMAERQANPPIPTRTWVWHSGRRTLRGWGGREPGSTRDSGPVLPTAGVTMTVVNGEDRLLVLIEAVDDQVGEATDPDQA